MSNSEIPTTELRNALFNETDEMLPPFKDVSWRGCVLDRDSFDNRRIPKELFEAIMASTFTENLFICGYFTDGETCHKIPASWNDYSNFMLSPKNWSIEYVVHAESNSWAILADADVTVFGASRHIADAIDSHLSSHSTSLQALTLPLCTGSNLVAVNYIHAVIGAL